MTLETLNDGASPEGRELIRVLRELQGLKINVLSGAAAAASITVSGLGTDDTIKSVVYFPITAGAVTSVSDLTSEASIFAANTLRLSTTNTTGGKLVLFWYDKSAL